MALKKGSGAEEPARSPEQMSHALIISHDEDPLALYIANQWLSRGRSHTWLSDKTLASAQVSLVDGQLQFHHQPITSILWRVQPGRPLSCDFIQEDVGFADTEARAFWLAALALPSIRTNFRPHPSQLFSRSGWQHWRTILSESGLPLYPLEFGYEPKDFWLPHCQPYPRETPQSKSACGLGLATLQNGFFWRVDFAGSPAITANLSHQQLPYVQDALEILVANNLYLGTLIMADQRVLAVDSSPEFKDQDHIKTLADPLLILL